MLQECAKIEFKRRKGKAKHQKDEILWKTTHQTKFSKGQKAKVGTSEVHA